MKPHYFDDPASAADEDPLLKMAKAQGYVPPTCLLGGAVVMGEMNAGRDPCDGCNGPRARCHGRPKREDSDEYDYRGRKLTEREKNAPAWTRLR